MLSIIIPAYNEEERIKKTLEDYVNHFNHSEIIVVLNGCTDDTLGIVKEFPRVKYLNIREAIGKGAAIIEGFKVAQGDYIAFVDADCATTPEMLNSLLLKIAEHDGIIGSRWTEGGAYLNQSNLRILASKTYAWLVKSILGLDYKDFQCPAKVFKKEIIKEVLTKLHGFNYSFDTELLYHLKGKDILEVPLIWKHQEGSQLKLFKTARKMFYTIIWLRLKGGKNE